MPASRATGWWSASRELRRGEQTQIAPVRSSDVRNTGLGPGGTATARSLSRERQKPEDEAPTPTARAAAGQWCPEGTIGSREPGGASLSLPDRSTSVLKNSVALGPDPIERAGHDFRISQGLGQQRWSRLQHRLRNRD
jgi:hypothetical protein